MVNLTSTRRATGNFPADTVTWEVPVFIMALTFLVFLPAQWNGFTNWDDPLNLINNNQYRGFGWTQLRWMFTTFHGTLYRPATWLTLALDHRLWGMDPAGYHLTSVLFHCLNAAIFYYIALALLRMAAPEPALSGWALVVSAGVSALLFALHPLRVEAVTWVSARNDVVAPTGWLLAFYGYLRACAATSSAARKAWLWVALIAYAFSLLAKSVGMTLPLVLGLVDICPLRRIDLADARPTPGPGKTPSLGEIAIFCLSRCRRGGIGPGQTASNPQPLEIRLGGENRRLRVWTRVLPLEDAGAGQSIAARTHAPQAVIHGNGRSC